MNNDPVREFPAIASDADLARHAQGGDTAALGLLLERHRTALHAHALRLVGHDHAGDAVQDLFILALRKIDQVRDPDAVVGWLHTALRSICLSRLRRGHGELPVNEVEPPAPAREAPEESIDRLALRDWVWTAIGELTEPLRVVAMLRYFGSYSSYEEIASICGVPVGTVRSRLNQVKVKLADAMLETATAAHGEATALANRRARMLTESAASSPDAFVASMAPDLEVIYAATGNGFKGRDTFAMGAAMDQADGVVFMPTAVIAGPGITILEARFINPPWDLDHCPPAISQIHYHRGDETHRMVWYYAPRVAADA